MGTSALEGNGVVKDRFRYWIAFSVLVMNFALSSHAEAQKDLIVVVGAPGEAEFGDQFLEWGKRTGGFDRFVNQIDRDWIGKQTTTKMTGLSCRKLFRR